MVNKVFSSTETSLILFSARKDEKVTSDLQKTKERLSSVTAELQKLKESDVSSPLQVLRNFLLTAGLQSLRSRS